MMFSEKIKQTTAVLFYNESLIGSGVVFSKDKVLYVITAAHVLYGNQFEKEPQLDLLVVEIYDRKRYKIKTVNQNVEFSKENDIVLLELEIDGEQIDLPDVKFAPQPHLSKSEFFFRGSYGKKDLPVNKGVVRYQERYKHEQFRFFGTIPKEQLLNSNFNAGNEWLSGCSGSGLFLSNGPDIICCGILTEIPDKGDNGQLLFCSVEALGELGLIVPFLPNEIYDVNPGELTSEWFSAKLKVALDALGKRYTPELNFDLPISKELNGLSRNSEFGKEFTKRFAEIYEKRRQCYYGFSNELTKDQQIEIDKKLGELNALYLGTDLTGFAALDYNGYLEHCNYILGLLEQSLDTLYEDQEIKEKDNPTPAYGTKPYHSVFQDLYGFRRKIERFVAYINSVTCKLANNPFIILQGEAGFGKSHLLGDFCQKRSEQGDETILLLGQHFVSNDEVWHQILQKRLNINFTEEQFLTQLNIRAHLTGRRIIIVVDALNEGMGREIWRDRLKSFINSIANYDGLGLLVSVRTTYHDLLVDESIYNENLANNLIHNGFSEYEYEASDFFFDNYNIVKPSIPLLHPEFRSPLFLKLFCEGLSAKGLNTVPEGYEGITSIFDFFLEAINFKLSTSMAFDPSIKVVHAAVQALAKELIQTRKQYVPYDRAVSLLTEIDQAKLIERPQFLARTLVDENIIRRDSFIDEDGHWEDGVNFLYERFFDHITVRNYLNQLEGDLRTAFMTNGSLHYIFPDTKSISINSGLIEAFSIQVPEKFGVEFFELIPHLNDNRHVCEGLISSLIWRKKDSIKYDEDGPLKKYLPKAVGDFHLHDYFLETILLISGVPGHPFNGEYIHSALMKVPMNIRDSEFSFWATMTYDSNRSVIHRLLDWAWKDEPKSELSDESILLSTITISWFLSSPDRRIRDGATKAIICLLQHRGQLLVSLLDKFKEVNDPYVYERLTAIAYGCVMRAKDLTFLPSLCEYIYENIFNKDIVYPNILVRDYAACVIEFAEFNNIQLSFDTAKCYPPYRSLPITDFPTNDEIDKEFRLTHKDSEYFNSQNAILDSMVTEYGRGVSRYGDFGRYVFGSAMRKWKVNDGAYSNFGVKRIFELGYDVELHGKYDSYSGRGEGRERIGKKYQWIVFHEILARLSDNSPMFDDANPENKADYKGAWQPSVRDIDPSMVIKSTMGKDYDIPNDLNCWWLATT